MPTEGRSHTTVGSREQTAVQQSDTLWVRPATDFTSEHLYPFLQNGVNQRDHKGLVWGLTY